MPQNDAAAIVDVDVALILDGLFGVAVNMAATRGVDVALSGMPERIGDRIQDRLLQSNCDFDYGATEDELADAIAELTEAEKGHPVIAPFVEILRGRYLT